MNNDLNLGVVQLGKSKAHLVLHWAWRTAARGRSQRTDVTRWERSERSGGSLNTVITAGSVAVSWQFEVGVRGWCHRSSWRCRSIKAFYYNRMERVIVTMLSFSSMELSFGPQLLLWGSLSSWEPWCPQLCWKKGGGGGSGEGFNLINAPLDESAASRLYPSITWTLSLRPALQSGCPASSAPPPGLRSGASAERCRSLPQTRHWSTPEGSWASWRSLWLLWKADSVNTTSPVSLNTSWVLKLGVAVWLHASLAFLRKIWGVGFFFLPTETVAKAQTSTLTAKGLQPNSDLFI